MLFPEEDAPLLKAWIVKRIENTSDADADVLAEYVIALLKHDGDREAVRTLCEQEIPDFLSEDPKAFLDDVFQAINYKTYVPGAPPAPVFSTEMAPAQPALFDSAPHGGSRKRGFHDRDDFDGPDGRDGPHQAGRAFKQPRRGGRGGRGDDMRGGGHAGPHGALHGFPTHPDMPNFDPNNPMEAFMQLQAMGLPYPGMPNFPQAYGGGRGQQRRKGRCRDFDTKGFCSRGSTCQYDHGNESIFMPPSLGPSGEDYDPNDAMFAMANSQNQMNPFGFQPDMGGRGRGGRRNRSSKKGGARAPFSADGPVHDRSKTTIVIENIPEESFSEDVVREFFSQFGSVQEVSMQPYKHLAIVKYDKWGSANAAYKSPKVIFDNRFVKVFWYKDESENLPTSVPLNGGNWSGDPSTLSEDQEPEPELDMEEFQQRQDEAQKQHQERELKRAELERRRLELEHQQQELLARHREENERLQAKLNGQSTESGDTPSSGTDMLRAKLAQLEQEAKILGIDPDAEDDTGSSYQHHRGGYRGRGGPRSRGFAPRGRGSTRGRGGNMHAAYAQYSIDNRPKKLAVTGVDFTAAEKDEVLRHFLLNLGEFESVDPSPSVTHVSFQDRKTAERFYYSLHGKELPGVEGRLDLAWVSTPLPPVKTHAVAAAEDTDGAMTGFNDAPHEEAEPVRQREERAVDMDYEVADDDGW
ncbi:hypothetical protein B0J13DRAFT_540942 [Dactylonectria estremocensis]|uniref:C3H1-type domain-containing protein n=1 Tax=Dactylonectria estremocensis TaxID=1079267 RepID=A0A9P9FER3_9HYPO|nr:hypothetical protein B0J13DRAFT_540942 [Dactylonectria estremocensis]